MKVIEVSPLSQKVAKDSLTYFSSKEVSPGDVVSVEVRKRIYDALVVSVREAKDLKADIRNASFGFKKVLEVKEALPIYREFFEAARDTKDFFVGNLGQIISALLPAAFLSALGQTKTPQKHISKPENKIFSFQAAREDREKFYKNYFRECFGANKSVLVCFPTIQEAKDFYATFKNEFTSFLFYGSLKEKKFLETYNNCLASKTPCLIVTTPAGLFIPRHDLGTLILEHESSSHYRTIKRPYFSVVTFAKFLAKRLKTDLVLADEILSTETIFETSEKNYEPLLPLQFEIDYAPKIKTIDMKDKVARGKNYLLSETSLSLIEKTLEKKARIFLFTLRKGLASEIVCHDCGKKVRDDGVPVVLFHDKAADSYVLKNAITRETLESKLRCENCGSWNFDTLGIGTDKVYEEIKERFLKAKIFQIDKEVVGSDARAKKIAVEFLETPGSVLIGTEMAIPYLTKKPENTILISADSLLNIPSFKTYERLLHLVLSLASVTQKNFLIQSRNIKNPVIESFVEKDLAKLFEYDIEKRREFKYPPFGTIIKISHLEKAEKAAAEKTFFEKLLVDHKPIIHQARLKKFVKTTAILRLPRESWDDGNFKTPMSLDKKLLAILSYLGPDFEIRLNPERLF